jgi:hypothetical protein
MKPLQTLATRYPSASPTKRHMGFPDEPLNTVVSMVLLP